MIEAKDLTVMQGGKPVLHSVGLSVPDGMMLGVVGPNGSGKTTLLRCLYGSVKPLAGSVHADGMDLSGFSRREIARRIAVVPQDRPADTGQSLFDTILLGRLPHRPLLSGAKAADIAVASGAIARVGLADRANQSFGSLSGGEAQRGLIARALCQGAEHLLLDEPTNHLDLRYQHDILSLVRGLRRTTIVVLHDLNLAARYCDRIALLDEGRVSALGTPAEILTPDIIEPIYKISATRLERASGLIHLVFAENDLSSSLFSSGVQQ